METHCLMQIEWKKKGVDSWLFAAAVAQLSSG